MNPPRSPLFRKAQHIHFVGIGGSGMSGIAEVLLNLNFTVSGSDLAHTPVTERLAERGRATRVLQLGALGGRPCTAEVDQPDRTLLAQVAMTRLVADQPVLGLDDAVHDPARVQELQYAQDVSDPPVLVVLMPLSRYRDEVAVRAR